MNNRTGTPPSTGQSQEPWDIPPEEPWYMSRDEELEALQRVEENLLVQFREQTTQKAASSGTRWGLWATLGSGAVAMAALAFFWLNPSQSLPPLQMQGGLQAQKTNTPKTTKKTWQSFQAPKKKSGILNSPTYWNVKLAGGTSLQLQRKGKRTSFLRLQKGHVDVHVIPKRMKQFSVRCQGVEVLVKGTQFTVEQHREWVRVEVWRGLVGIKPTTQNKFDLPRQQGVQIFLKTGTWKRYQLPPSTHRSPAKRLQWLAQNSPSEVRDYLHYLQSSTQFDRVQVSQILQEAADWARQKKKLRLVWSWRWKVYKLGGDEQESALAEAADYCVRAGLAQKRCLKLYTLYFQRFGNSTSPLFLNVLWTLRDQKTLKFKARVALLQNTLNTLSNSRHQQVQQTIARLLLTHGTTCKQLKNHPQLPKQGDRWLQKRCPGLFPTK